jgi:hypothetical protein
MKVQKFKLERKVLEQSLATINGLKTRIRIIMSHVINDNPNDSQAFDILNLYFNALKDYSKEIENILTMPGHIFLIPDHVMNKLNSHKKEADFAENMFSKVSNYSLRVH